MSESGSVSVSADTKAAYTQIRPPSETRNQLNQGAESDIATPTGHVHSGLQLQSGGLVPIALAATQSE
jgi:hypothetical protein